MVCWYLWNNRNNIVWNQKSSETTIVVHSAILSLIQWESAQDMSFNNYVGFIIMLVLADRNWNRENESLLHVMFNNLKH